MAVDDASRRPSQAYATVSPVGTTMTSQKEKTVVSLLNGPLSKLNCLKFKPELLLRMDSLYAFYHKQWWCYRKMLNHFKFVNALFNGLALLLMAAGMIAGPLLENSTLVACLAAVGTVVKGWTDFKQYRFKVTMRVCVYHVRQSLDGIENPRAWCSLGGPGKVFDQDANVG